MSEGQDQLTEIAATVKRIERRLLGDLSSNEPGLIEEVRDIKQKQRTQLYWFRAVVGSVLSAVGVWLWDQVAR